MRKYFSLTIILLAASVLTASAQGTDKPLQTITLKDGSSIQGHLVGMAGQDYVIENKTMGQVKVPAAQVVGINTVGAKAPAPTMGQQQMGGQQLTPQIKQAQSTIMQDQQIMGLMQEMMADPELSQLMQDPALMQAAMSGDPASIQNNPAAQKLLQNPKMQKVLELTAQKLQASGQIAPQQ